MSKRANTTLIGAFVVGAITLLTTAIILFGGDAFFSRQETVVMYFDGSVDGLQVGAPVNVRGVQVGTVTQINLEFNTATGDIKIPVIAEIDAVSVNQARQLQADDPLKAIIENLGLRAQLKIQSILTSLLYVDLDYHPGTPLHYHGDGTFIEIPTIPMPMEQFGKALNEISVQQMLTDISSSLSAINRIVNSDEVTDTITNMRDAFANINNLSEDLNREIVPLAQKTSQTMDDISTGLDDMKAILENLRQITADDSPLLNDLDGAIKEVTTAAQTISNLQDMPQMQKLDSALSEIEMTARQLRTLEDSPQMINLNTAMEELADAARAVRNLADAIDRNPEILLRGRTAAE
jgi:paraquat-inducible protein B